MAAGWCAAARRLDPGRRHAPGADAGVSTRSAYIERARRGRAGLRSGGGVAAVAPAAAGGRGHAGAVRQGRARRRAGPTAAARGGPRAGAAAAHPAARARGWGVVPGLHGGAGHPLAAAGLGRAAAHESAQLQPPFPRAHRHVLRPMASARLRGAGAGAAGGGRSVTVIALDFGYQGPAAFSTMFRRVLGAAPPPTCAPTRTLHSTQEVLLQRDAAEPALPVRRHAWGSA